MSGPSRCLLKSSLMLSSCPCQCHKFITSYVGLVKQEVLVSLQTSRSGIIPLSGLDMSPCRAWA